MPKSAEDLVANMRIALLVGIASAGKDSILRKLMESDDYARIITTIPRAPRPNEINGVDYYFINDEIVRQNLLDHKYFETKMVHGRVYGTTTAELERIAGQQKIALGDVEVQGVDEYHTVAGDNLTAIFVIPPDYETWQERWLARGEMTPDEKLRRTNSAVMELDHALKANYYRFLINDNLDRAAKVADELIHGRAANYKDDFARIIAHKLHDDIVKTL